MGKDDWLPKHRDKNCQRPFCDICWQRIKANVRGIMNVADELSKPIKQEDKE